LSIALVLMAEGGRRWAERRLTGEHAVNTAGVIDAEEPAVLAEGLVASAGVSEERTP
jgi:hypothetical protein